MLSFKLPSHETRTCNKSIVVPFGGVFIETKPSTDYEKRHLLGPNYTKQHELPYIDYLKECQIYAWLSNHAYD